VSLYVSKKNTFAINAKFEQDFPEQQGQLLQQTLQRAADIVSGAPGSCGTQLLADVIHGCDTAFL